MYLMVSHIPVYVQGDRLFIDVSWQCDLLLARDWLARPFGELTLLCPSLPMDGVEKNITQLVPIGRDDGIRVVPSFDLRCRARQFWTTQRHQWNADVQRELASAKVVHCSAADVFRPMWYLAHSAAVRSRVTTVLVGPDMDPHLTQPPSFRGRAYCGVFDYLMKRAANNADSNT